MLYAFLRFFTVTECNHHLRTYSSEIIVKLQLQFLPRDHELREKNKNAIDREDIEKSS